MPHWFHRLFHNDIADEQLDAELQFHLEHQIQDNLASGMTPEDARRQAQIELGGVEQVRQKTRDVHWENWIENIFRDLRFAVRSLNKDWRLALTAIVSLALGIGASTVVFSVFYNMLFNAFDTRDANRLVIPMREGFNPGEIPQPLSCWRDDIEAVRQQNHVFEDVAGYSARGVFDLVRNDITSRQLDGVRVTGNAFTFYGVPALLGRGIVPEDEKPGAESVFVISYDAWKNEFNSDPQVVGKNFIVSEQPRTLVGVMPPRFHAYNAHADLWMPFNNPYHGLYSSAPGIMLARLRPGVSLAAASAELKLIIDRLEKAHPPNLSNDSEKHFNGRIETATDFLMGPTGLGSFEAFLGNPGGFDLKRMIYSLLVGGLLLLLMACINVANLLLARATVREKEIAVRSALGASRGRLVQQLLLESSVLAIAACVVGCIFAYFGAKGANEIIPKGRPPFSLAGGEIVVGLDRLVLLFAIAITALTTLVCGLAPAFHAAQRDFQPQLAGSGKGISGDFRHGKLRNSLVIGQVAISVVLLIGASLLIYSFFRLTHIDLGFNPNNLLIGIIGPGPNRQVKENFALIEQKVLQQLESSPGIASISSYALFPGYMGGSGEKVTVPGSGRIEDAGVMSGDEKLAQTLEFRLIRGRWLSKEEVDSAQYVTVINQRMARDLFEDVNPVGQKLEVKSYEPNSQPAFFPHYGVPDDKYFQIIGVMEDVKNFGITQPALPEAIVPNSILKEGALMIRTKVDPASLMRPLQQQMWAIDPDIAFAFFMPYTQMLNNFTFAAPKLVIAAVAPLAAIGLLLVIIGVFGVMAYNVSLQTHDIGIRLALGAGRRDILRMVLKKGLMLIAAGVVIGVGASLGLTRFIASQLWGVSPTDPWTFAAVIVGIVVVGLAACFFPARRATQVDPAITLRYE